MNLNWTNKERIPHEVNIYYWVNSLTKQPTLDINIIMVHIHAYNLINIHHLLMYFSD